MKYFLYTVNVEIFVYMFFCKLENMNTVNVDIFACIHFRGFMKMGNFACIKIRILCTIGSLG